MDPLSATASVWTALEASRVILGAARTTIQDIRHAEERLASVRSGLNQLQHELDSIAKTAAFEESDQQDHLRQAMADAIRITRETSSKMHALLNRRYAEHARLSLKARLTWTLADKRRIAEQQTALEKNQESLLRLMRALMFQSCIGTDMRLKQLEKRLCPPEADDKSTLQAEYRLEEAPFKEHRPSHTTLVWAFRYVGGALSLSKTWRPGSCDFHVYAEWRMPATILSGSGVGILSLSLRHTQYDPYQIRLNTGSSLCFRRTVPSQCAFIQACRDNKHMAVREMLETGEGRWTDMTEDRRMPLTYAVENGSCEVIEELIAHNADIDVAFGRHQTTALQWALRHGHLRAVELLLNAGADSSLLSSHGWNALFYCWPALRPKQGLKTAYIDLLSKHDVQDLGILDKAGWSCLHRVSAYGEGSEVQQLLVLGADPHQVDRDQNWNAIQHAVHNGNTGTFEVLATYHLHELDVLLDHQHWTLLHIAAAAGHFDIVPQLLQLGADHEVLSGSANSGEENSQITPQQAAAAYSSEREYEFLLTLESVRPREQHEGVDKFFDAVENFGSV